MDSRSLASYGSHGGILVVNGMGDDAVLKWWLIIESNDGHFFLEAFKISTAATPPIVAQTLRTMYYGRMSWVYAFFNQHMSLSKPVIMKAEVSSIFSPDLEGTVFPLRVTISSASVDETLTSGFYDPDLLEQAINFSAAYSEFVITDPGAVTVPLRACMIDLKTDKHAVVRFISIALQLAVAAGISAGSSTSRVDIGWALGGGLVALVAAFEMVFLWLLK